MATKRYDPRLKTKVLLYGYAAGVFSSRKLMAACREQLPLPHHLAFVGLTEDNA